MNHVKKVVPLLILALQSTGLIADTSTTAVQPDAVVGAALHHKAKHRKHTNFKELEIIKMVDGKFGLFDGKSVLESYQAL